MVEPLGPVEEDRLWQLYLRTKSRESYESLVENYLPLVFAGIDRLSIRVRNKLEKEELLGAGVMGLHNALLSFNRNKGNKFSTYAYKKIHGALVDELRKQDHLTRDQRKRYHQICAAIKKLANRFSRYPTHAEISMETGLEEQQIVQYIGMASNAISLDNINDDGISYKNMIADDPNPPMRPSGIRFGTPAITTRGFKEKECARVAELMIETLRNHEDESIKTKVHEEIKALAAKFPIPDKHF